MNHQNNHQNIIDLKIDHISLNNNDKLVIDRSISKYKPGILLIHAHWCGHCQIFLPKYKQIAEILNKPNELNVPVLGIESEELNNDKLQTKTKVFKLNFRGFPTIKFFDQNGVIMDKEYSGSREINDILKELCNRYHKCYNEKGNRYRKGREY